MKTMTSIAGKTKTKAEKKESEATVETPFGYILDEITDKSKVLLVTENSTLTSELKEEKCNVEIVTISNLVSGKIGTKTKFDQILIVDELEKITPDAFEKLLTNIEGITSKVTISIYNIRHIGIIASMISGNFSYAEKGILSKENKHFYTPVETISLLWEKGYMCSGIKRNNVPATKTEFYRNDREYVTALEKVNNTYADLDIGCLSNTFAIEKLRKFYGDKDRETYSYLLTFTQKPAKTTTTLEKHIESLGFTLPKQQENKSEKTNDKWNVIIKTLPSRINVLADALYSLAIQTYPNISAIVAVHSSDTKAIEKVKELAKNFEGLLEVHVYQADASKYRGHPVNVGLDHADGRYVSFLDDDDIYYPNSGEVLIKELKKGKYNFVYGTSVGVHQNKTGDFYKTFKIRKEFGEEFDYLKLLANNYIPNNVFIYDLDEFRDLRINEELPIEEDWDLLYKLVFSNRLRPKYFEFDFSEYRLRTDVTNSFKYLDPSTIMRGKRVLGLYYQNRTFAMPYKEVFKYLPDVNSLQSDHYHTELQQRDIEARIQDFMHKSTSISWLIKRVFLVFMYRLYPSKLIHKIYPQDITVTK